MEKKNGCKAVWVSHMNVEVTMFVSMGSSASDYARIACPVTMRL